MNQTHLMTTVQEAFTLAFDGDTAATAQRLNIPLAVCIGWTGTEWFKTALEDRALREAKLVSKDRQEMFREVIAARLEIQALWSRVMKDEGIKMENRLAASKLLAQSQGMMIEKLEVDTKGEQTVIVKKEALEERVLGLAKRRMAMEIELVDFLN